MLLVGSAWPVRAAEAIGVTPAPPAPTASPRSTGKRYYSDGEFKKAVAQFRRATEIDPSDAESHYWMGMSYEKLADIAIPFDGKYRSKARLSLTRAMELAPDRQDYRRELFNFLLDGDGASPASFRQAAEILATVRESDPDYADMRQHLGAERKVNSALEARLTWLFLAAPRAAYRIADLPAAAILQAVERR